MLSTPANTAAYNVDEYRLEAERLLHDLRSDRRAVALRAAKRIQSLEQWRSRSLADIRQNSQAVDERDAQAVIARENGFADWPHLTEQTSHLPIVFDTRRLFPASTDIFLNYWFHDYGDARQLIESEPDLFLFPYGSQYVVCEPAMLVWLRIDLENPDWIAIGHDWARPGDPAAKTRLAALLHRTLV